MGYYCPANNQVVINRQSKKGLTHYFFDTTFKMLYQYEEITKDRRLTTKTNKFYFLRQLCLQNDIMEIYANADSIFIYKLDATAKKDILIENFAMRNTYSDEQLITVMPSLSGCNFLSLSLKNKKIILHKWNYNNKITSIISSDLPSGLFTKQELKERGDYIDFKYSSFFRNCSVSHTTIPENFTFPLTNQIFYNDSLIYIVHRIPYNLGTNVFSIDITTAKSNSRNYFINKYSEAPPKYQTVPFATIYDSLLIIQNCSATFLQYHFFNVFSGERLAMFAAKADNSLYNIVNSPLTKVGTFESADDTKELSNEKHFLKQRNADVPFLKAMIDGDSLVLAFGSMKETKDNKAFFLYLFPLALFEVPLLTELAIDMARSAMVSLMPTIRNLRLFAYSKFSLKGLKPSASHSISSFINDMVADKRLDQLTENNSLIIDAGTRLFFCVYSNDNKNFSVITYQ